MDRVEQPDRVARLVGLQRPDQVKRDIGIFRLQRRPLGLGLLDPVFAEHTLAGGDDRRDRCRPERLRDGDQRHARRVAPCLVAGRGDLPLHGKEAFGFAHADLGSATAQTGWRCRGFYPAEGNDLNWIRARQTPLRVFPVRIPVARLCKPAALYAYRRMGKVRMASVGSTWGKARETARLGIRARLIALVLVALVPLMLDRARDIGTDRAERIQAAAEQASRLARQGMATQNELIVSARAFLQVITSTYPVDPSDPSWRQDCIRLLTKTVVQAPWLKVLSVLRADGRIFCSSNLDAIGLDVARNPHIVQAMQSGEFVVGDYFVGVSVGPSLAMALPRRAANGAIDAVFTALLDLTWFGRVAADVTAQPGSVALMVDGTGTLLARHPSLENWAGRQF